MSKQYRLKQATRFFLCVCVSTAAYAQSDWPSRPITIVVPFPPGGQTDAMIRTVSEPISKLLGQTVVVENVAGVNGSLGTDRVARARPDGYTLVATGPGSHSINHLINRTVKYDPAKDFSYLGLIARTPVVMIASKNVKATNVQGVVAHAKANPGALTFAITGVGSAGHMAMELFKLSAGVDFTTVPYKGDAPAITDVIGGQVDLLIVSAVPATPQIQAGKVRALAVTSRERSAALPDVPTMIEQGLTKVVVESWTGLAAPAGTPPAVTMKINSALNEALRQPDIVKQFADRGMTVSPGTREDNANFIKAEVEKWSQVVKAANIRSE